MIKGIRCIWFWYGWVSVYDKITVCPYFLIGCAPEGYLSPIIFSSFVYNVCQIILRYIVIYSSLPIICWFLWVNSTNVSFLEERGVTAIKTISLNKFISIYLCMIPFNCFLNLSPKHLWSHRGFSSGIFPIESSSVTVVIIVSCFHQECPAHLNLFFAISFVIRGYQNNF